MDHCVQLLRRRRKFFLPSLLPLNILNVCMCLCVCVCVTSEIERMNRKMNYSYDNRYQLGRTYHVYLKMNRHKRWWDVRWENIWPTHDCFEAWDDAWEQFLISIKELGMKTFSAREIHNIFDARVLALEADGCRMTGTRASGDHKYVRDHTELFMKWMKRNGFIRNVDDCDPMNDFDSDSEEVFELGDYYCTEQIGSESPSSNNESSSSSSSKYESGHENPFRIDFAARQNHKLTEYYSLHHRSKQRKITDFFNHTAKSANIKV